MKVTLFGGSFNPPHLGHALVVGEFLESGLTDELWLLPTGNHAFGKELIDSSHRLAMTKLLIEFLYTKLKLEALKIKLCPVEIDLNLSGKTIDTIEALRNTNYVGERMGLEMDNEDIEFSFLMGSDLLSSFKKWSSWEELLVQMQFWIYERAGFDRVLYKNMKLFDVGDKTITNISSTQIRNKIENHKSTSLLLPDSIIAYIKEQNLYIDH